MGLSSLAASISFTLKMYRLYWANLISVMVILPATYLAVVVLFSGGVLESLVVGLTGYIVMACFTTMVYPAALQVANMFEEQVLELYASLPASLREIILSIIASQLVFAAPAVASGLIALSMIVGDMNALYVVASTLLSLAVFSTLAVLLGLTFKSRHRLDPVLTLSMMLVVVASPLFYRLEVVPEYWRAVLLVNPITHMICLLREGVGFSEAVSPAVSLSYLLALLVAFLALVFYRTRTGVLTVLERG